MTEKNEPRKIKLHELLIVVGVAAALAYFGGTIVGEKIAEYQNAADAAQEE